MIISALLIFQFKDAGSKYLKANDAGYMLTISGLLPVVLLSVDVRRPHFSKIYLCRYARFIKRT